MSQTVDTTVKPLAQDPHQARDERSMFGFWVYLMTDLVLFASLFATFIVLRQNTYGGPSERELYDLPFVLIETMLLLTSSFICGLAVIAAKLGRKSLAIGLLIVTGLLGAAFLGMELYEFAHLAQEGHSWRASASLSAFFTLVGTHGIHILIGLIWVTSVIVLIVRRGLNSANLRRLGLFSLFWHFLDVVWIFIFTIVYLIGAL